MKLTKWSEKWSQKIVSKRKVKSSNKTSVKGICRTLCFVMFFVPKMDQHVVYSMSLLVLLAFKRYCNISTILVLKDRKGSKRGRRFMLLTCMRTVHMCIKYNKMHILHTCVVCTSYIQIIYIYTTYTSNIKIYL